MAAAAGTANVDVWSAPDSLATELPALEHVAGATPPRRPEVRWDSSSSLRRPPRLRSRCRRSSRIGSRWSATPRMACIRSRAGRQPPSRCGECRRGSPVGAVGDPGAPILLERYAQARRAGTAMQTVTDGLACLFGVPAPWIRTLRNRGMRAVDAVGPLKRLLAQPALR
jgi:hypothetical protein